MKYTDGELAEMVKVAYRQIRGEFTPADVTNKVLEAHPDVDRDDLDAVVKAVLRFYDVDFEWNELGARALRCQDEGLDLLRRGLALLDEDEDEAYRLRDQGNAKIEEANKLQAEYNRMGEKKIEEHRQITELWAAHPDCKTLSDLKRKLAS
jgi:hypothetical protein